MNKVMVICSNFPPVRNGGTIRCEKLAKYLPEYGWETVVLTKKISNNTKLDYSLNLEYCKIYRTNSFDLAFIYTNLRDNCKCFLKKYLKHKINKPPIKQVNQKNDAIIKRRISEYFLIPDSDIFWAIGSLIKSLSIIKCEKPQIIFSSGPSHSVHIIGLFLKKITKKNWIIEFRDPWTMNPFNIPKPYKLLTIIDNYLEKIILNNADRINVTSEVYKYQFLNKYSFLENRKIVHIPNGYDPEDFNGQIVNENKTFTIVHTGNFYQHRSSSVFIEAIISLLKNEKLKPDNILVKFVGLLDEKGKCLIANSEFFNTFQITGQISHKESITEICNADLLLLIPGPGEGTIPGKFYEYLAASKPIFCIGNEGPTCELINEYHIGIVTNDINIEEISNNLLAIITEIKNKTFIFQNIDILKEKFNRKNIACEMAKVLDNEVFPDIMTNLC